jgi:hypothetical protein
MRNRPSGPLVTLSQPAPSRGGSGMDVPFAARANAIMASATGLPWRSTTTPSIAASGSSTTLPRSSRPVAPQRTGERLFSPATVERIQAIVQGQSAPVRVLETPVFHFAA